MIVQCVRIIGSATGKPMSEHSGIQVGGKYLVLEVYAGLRAPITTKFRVLNIEDEAQNGSLQPALWAVGMFEVLSDRVPSCWTAQITDDQLLLAPLAWRHPRFWDEVWDGVPAALSVFEEQKALILAEA